MMFSLTTAPARSRLADVSARVSARVSAHDSYQVWFPLAVYVAARLVDLILILVAARHQVDLPPGATQRATYGSVASNWDGAWYLRIATHGYPGTIPRDAAGHPLQNEWGFYPAYPMVVGAIMRLSGLGFMVVAPILSLLLGAAAVSVMFRLVNQTAGRFAASATVLLTCTYMAAPAMQIAYTESMGLLLVCTALLFLRNRRYGWLIPVLVTLALTRAVALAFVPVLVVHGIARYRRRSIEPFPVRDRWLVVGLAGLAVAVTGLWPLIAAVTTGNPAAYTQTMSSWGGDTGRLRVLTEFPVFASARGGIVGLVVLGLIIAFTAALVLRHGARVWGPEVRAWAGFYPLYLLLVTAPGSSNIRHLFLAFPLMWAFPEAAATRSERRFRVLFVALLALVGLAVQWVWISKFLVVSGLPDAQPFP
jgi:hypothetical protein